MSGNLNFTVVANNFISIVISVLKQDGTPFDMTGFSAIWQLLDPVTNKSLVTKKTSDSSLTISTNTLNFSLLPADTVGLQNGDYKSYNHEAIVIDSSGNPVTITNSDSRLSWGTATVRKELTVQP